MGRAVGGDQPAPTCRGCPSTPMLAVPEARTPSRPIPEAYSSRGHPKVTETTPTTARLKPWPRLKHPYFILSFLPTPTPEAKSCLGRLRPWKLSDGMREDGDKWQVGALPHSSVFSNQRTRSI